MSRVCLLLANGRISQVEPFVFLHSEVHVIQT